MKTTGILILLSTLSLTAHATDIKLNCTLRYDIDDKDEIEIPAIVDGDRILFNYIKDDAITYYFPSYGPAVWHNDAIVNFEGVLKDGVLTYSYDFKNYLRDEASLKSVFTETRSLELDYEEINDGEKHYFDYDDGEVISSKVNKDDWINDNGVQIDDCEIYDEDLQPSDELIPLTPRQEHRRRQGPEFFERLFNS